MELKTRSGIRGEVEIKVFDKFGNLKEHRPFAPNQVQDAGLAVMADRILLDGPGSEAGVDWIASSFPLYVPTSIRLKSNWQNYSMFLSERYRAMKKGGEISHPKLNA